MWCDFHWEPWQSNMHINKKTIWPMNDDLYIYNVCWPFLTVHGTASGASYVIRGGHIWWETVTPVWVQRLSSAFYGILLWRVRVGLSSTSCVCWPRVQCCALCRRVLNTDLLCCRRWRYWFVWVGLLYSQCTRPKGRARSAGTRSWWESSP